MIPITQKLTKNEAKDGHSSPSLCQRSSPVGIAISRTSRVIATAKTPSLKASSRFLVIRRGRYPQGRNVSPASTSRPLGVNGPAVDGSGAVEDRLRHRRMRVDDALQLGIAALERHHVADLADHVAGDVPDDVGAEDLAVLGIADDLDQTGPVVVDHRGARAAELELADLDLAAGLLRLLFGQADARHLGVGEGRARDEVDVDRLGFVTGGGLDRDHALLLGFVRQGGAANEVPDRKDSVSGGALVFVDLDLSAVRGLDAGGLEIERIGVRPAPAGDDEVVGLDLLVAGGDLDARLLLLDPLDLRAGQDLHAVLLELALDD